MPISPRLRVFLLWTLAALVIVLNVAYLTGELTTPRDGVSAAIFDFSPEGVRVNLVLPGGTHDVREGDLVTHIDGLAVGQWLVSGADGAARQSDAPVTYTLLRPSDPAQPGGPREELSVTVTPRRLDVLRIILRSPARLLLGLTFFGVALLVFVRRTRDSSAQLFWLIALNLFTLGLNDLLDYPVLEITRPRIFWLHFTLREMVISTGGMAASLGFAMTFPRRFAFVRRNGRWLFPLLALIALAAPWLTYALTPAGLARVAASARVVLGVMFAYLAATVIFFAANLLATTDPVQRAQLRWVSWGLTVGLLPTLALFLGPLLISGQRIVPFDVVVIPLLVIPFAFGIAIARYRLWDIEVVINRSIVYSIVLVVLGVVYLVAVTGLQRLVVGLTGTQSDLTIVTSTMLIAGLFQPVRQRVQGAVDKTLFAGQHAARMRLRQYGRQVENVVDLQALLDDLLAHVCKPLNATSGYVLLPEDDSRDAPLVTAATYGQASRALTIRPGQNLYAAMERGRVVVDPALESISLAVPMVAFGELVGALLLGPREVESDYNADDREALSEVGNQAALAIRVARLQARLLSAERFSAVGAAASAIVHDIKNQMGVAGGYAELLAQPDLAPEQREKFSHVFRGAIQGFTLMANEILDLARGESHVSIRPVQLSEFVEDMQPLIQRLCDDANITLDVDLGYEGQAPLDPARMQRVFFNLCDNAHDALLGTQPTGGRRITLSNELENGWVVFRVSDNGPGVPPAIRETLFDPFVTAQKSDGTGLGLAIVRKVVEAHGGDISLGGEAPPGATFVVRLPLQSPLEPDAEAHA